MNRVRMRRGGRVSWLYTLPWGRLPRLQIMTVRDLLAGKRVDALHPGGPARPCSGRRRRPARWVSTGPLHSYEPVCRCALPLGLLRLQVVNVKGCLLWRGGESTFDALLHSGHQDAVAEPLPTLLGIVNRHDRPATSRRASRVEGLALGQAGPVGMHRRECRLVLLLRTSRKVMPIPYTILVLLSFFLAGPLPLRAGPAGYHATSQERLR